MADLKRFLVAERERGKRIFPRCSDWFRALDLAPPDKVRVVILGQDPYHGEGQAHGLCFSVQPGVRPPPSLVNIYKELETDLGIKPRSHGFLEHWAEQGVLLLNSVLTVEMGQAASHRDRGWERFTDRIVREINAKSDARRVHAVGQLRAKEGGVRRFDAASRAEGAAPLAIVGTLRLPRLPPFLEGQCFPPEPWPRAYRLGVARAATAA